MDARAKGGGCSDLASGPLIPNSEEKGPPKMQRSGKTDKDRADRTGSYAIGPWSGLAGLDGPILNPNFKP